MRRHRRCNKKKECAEYLDKILRFYMSGREVLVPDGNHFEVMTVSCGVSQRSVLGLVLWNVHYNELTRVPFLDGVKLVGFADDMALIITKYATEEIEHTAGAALVAVAGWMVDHGLELVEKEIVVYWKISIEVNAFDDTRLYYNNH